MKRARHFARWIALFVLMNIGLGFCDCLRDPVLPPHSGSSFRLTSGGEKRGLPVCADDCDSCVCCAVVVITAPVHFAVELVTAQFTFSPPTSVSDPDHIAITHPPRA
jgi:hypothetical protein